MQIDAIAEDTPEQRDESTAYHEAGHAIIALVYGWPISSIAILKDNPKADGEVLLTDGDVPSRERPLESIAFLAAGMCAEQALFSRDENRIGSLWINSTVDQKVAVDILRDELGVTTNVSTNALLTQFGRCAFHFLIRDDVWGTVSALAQMLVKHRHLTNTEISNFWTKNTISQAAVDALGFELMQVWRSKNWTTPKPSMPPLKATV